MAAEERFLKASSEVYFFPENQHTPRTIQQSLTDQSGQFYEELTASDLVSGPTTPDRPNYTTEYTSAMKKSKLTIKPNKHARKRQSTVLNETTTEDGHQASTPTDLKGKAQSKFSNRGEATATKCLSGGASLETSQLFFPLRIIVFIFELLYWFMTLLMAPVRLFKMIILTWLCLRAFDSHIVVPVENSIRSKAIEAWGRLEFEPVQLYGDFTGWKHLIATASQGTARFVHDGKNGRLAPMNGLGEQAEVEEGSEEVAVSVMAEDRKKEGLEEDASGRVLQEEVDAKSSSFTTKEQDVEQTFSFLDRIDRALGWAPPPLR